METSQTNNTSDTPPGENAPDNIIKVSGTSKQLEVQLERAVLQNAKAIDDLRKLYPWPTEEPKVKNDWTGFFGRHHKHLFKSAITDNIEVVLELGSWLGKSARFIAQELPDNGIIICVDHWKGSPEFSEKTETFNKIPTAYETFIKNQWGLKDKTIAIKDSSQNGIKSVHMCGIKPDIVYIDAGHDYDNVSADINMCIETFPNALLIMDDYQKAWPGVMKAVDEAAEANKDYRKYVYKTICTLTKK